MNTIEIEKLIPHRKPFIMVDKILHYSEEKSTTSFFISKDTILGENEVFTEAGIIEHIAQSVAATRGYSQLSEDSNPKIGYIGSIKNLTIYALPKMETEITTEITILNQVLNFTSVHGKTVQNGTMIAECELTIATQ